MSRIQGDFPYPFYLERATNVPLDATTYVPSVQAMLNHDKPETLYQFMFVTVYNDSNPANNGVYQLMDLANRQDLSAWDKIVSENTFGDVQGRLDSVESAIPTLQNTQNTQSQAITQLSNQVNELINNPQVGSVAAAVQVPGQPFPSRPDALVVHWYTWDTPPLDPNHPYDQWFHIPEVIQGEPAVPSAFANFQWNTVDNGTGGSVQLSISSLPLSNPSITSIEYRVDEGTPVTLSSTTAPISHEITGLTDNQQVEIQVRAVNSIGAGDWSLIRTVTPTLINENDVPNAFIENMWNVTDLETGSDIRISVNALPTSVPAITNIEYRFRETSVSQNVWSNPISGISGVGDIDVSGLNTNVQYDFQIRAVNAEGPGQWSDIKTETPTEIVATPPAEFTAGMWSLTNVGDGETATITITSLPSSSPAITSIQYRIDGGSVINAPISGIGNFDIAPLNNPSYNFEIRAVNSAGPGAWSDIKNVVIEEFSGIIQIASENDFSGGGTCDFPRPSEVQAGDLIVVALSGQNNNGTFLPDGFIEAAQANPSTNVNPSSGLYYKIATASEPSSYQFFKSSPVVGSMIVYRGVDTLDPIVGTVVTTGGSSSSNPSIPGGASYGGQNTENMLVCVLGHRSNSPDLEPIELGPLTPNYNVIGNYTAAKGSISFISFTELHTSTAISSPQINVPSTAEGARRFAGCAIVLRKA